MHPPRPDLAVDGPEQMSGNELLGLAEARAWLAQHWPRVGVQTVPLAEASGRVAASDLAAPAPWPAAPCAREDGVAVAAADTQGAGVYSPVRLAWGAGRATRVAAGEPLPASCDAVVPAGVAAVDTGGVTLTAAVAVGEGVRRAGADVGAGGGVLRAGRRIGALEQARLTALGVTAVACRAPLPVILRPAADRDPATVALLSGLLRSPAIALRVVEGGIDEARPMAADEPGLVLAHGGSGEWAGDPLAMALLRSGELAARGVAMQPGVETRLGRAGESLVVGLPGQPWPAFAALWLLLRGSLGLAPVAAGDARLARKLSSPLGVSELVPLARNGDGVVPLPRDAGLPPAGLAGVLTVPEESEGHAAGEVVAVDWLEETVDG